MFEKNQVQPWVTQYKLPFGMSWEVTKEKQRRFTNNVVQVPNLNLGDTSLFLHKQFLKERYIVDESVIFAFSTELFYYPDYQDKEEFKRLKDLVQFIETELPNAGFIVSAENKFTNTYFNPAERDPNKFSTILLRKPNLTKALWPDTCWFWGDYLDAGSHNLFQFDPSQTVKTEARGNRAISPPLEDSSPNKKSFYIHCDVPEDRRTKWCRLSFDIRFEGEMDNLFYLDRSYVFGISPHVENEGWLLAAPDRGISQKARLKYSNGKINKNYTWYDEEEKVLHVMVDFHSFIPEILFVFDYDFRSLGELVIDEFIEQDHYGLVHIENIRFYDNHLLDDERDGGLKDPSIWDSLDATDNLAGEIPENVWLQQFKFYHWAAPLHKAWVAEMSQKSIEAIYNEFSASSSFYGYLFESSGLAVQGWDIDWPAQVPVALAVATYFHTLSKKVEELDPNLKIWAYGDCLNPYHNGKQFIRLICPKNGGMYDVKGYLDALQTPPNICWIEWGYGAPIQRSIDFWNAPENQDIHWCIGYSHDADNWYRDESKYFEKVFNESLESNGLLGGFELGEADFVGLQSGGMNDVALKNLLLFAETFRAGDVVLKRKLVKQEKE